MDLGLGAKNPVSDIENLGTSVGFSCPIIEFLVQVLNSSYILKNNLKFIKHEIIFLNLSINF